MKVKNFKNTQIGKSVEELGAISGMVVEMGKDFAVHPPSFSSVVNELYQLGVKSFIIVLVAALATGLVMAIQFGFGLARFGAKLYVPKIVTISIVRELGPMFTALMLSGRVA